MKTKDLIAALKEADPTGELEVCVRNVDILGVWTDPAYYDGCLQVLKRDEEGEFDHTLGAEFRSSGHKVVIHDMSIRDALLDAPEMPIAYDGPYAERNYSDVVDEWRREVRAINAEIGLPERQ